MHDEFVMNVVERKTDTTGNIAPQTQLTAILIIAGPVSKPFFLKGVITIQINLSMAIRAVAKVDTSTDSIIMEPINLHVVDDFHLKATYPILPLYRLLTVIKILK